MAKAADSLLEDGRTILCAQPFSRLLGAELLKLTETEAELRLAISDVLKQQHGFAHGGVVAYLADNTLSYANWPWMARSTAASSILPMRRRVQSMSSRP